MNLSYRIKKFIHNLLFSDFPCRDDEKDLELYSDVLKICKDTVSKYSIKELDPKGEDIFLTIVEIQQVCGSWWNETFERVKKKDKWTGSWKRKK